MVLILMGVTGTGKTTVGHALAKETGWLFADADDYHPERNREKMRSGRPLNDEDRAPWLESLNRQIVKWLHDGTQAILACSALKRAYRVKLVEGTAPDSVRFVYLHGPESVIRQRMEARRGHYMPPSLLPSQFAALEPPEKAIEVSIEQTVPEMVRQILEALKSSA